MKKKNILIVIPRYHTNYFHTIEALQKNGHKVKLFVYASMIPAFFWRKHFKHHVCFLIGKVTLATVTGFIPDAIFCFFYDLHDYYLDDSL